MLTTSSDDTTRRRRCRTQENKENERPLPRLESTPLLAAFRKAIQKTSQAEFWNQNESLWEIVVEYASDINNKINGPSLLLNESASSILKSCRTLIKEAVSAEKKNLDAIYVAVSAVRAILKTRPTKKMETIVRLLYHAIITCAEIKNERAGTVGLAAYEALGNTLSMAFHNHQGKTTSTVACTFPKLTKLVSSGETIPGISNDQLLDIGIYSTLAAVRSISFFLNNKKDPVDDGLELHIEIQRDNASTLLCDVALSWIQRVPDSKKQSSLCKQGHRLLWELANQSDQMLQLQRDSIRVLLLDGKSSLNFENACTYSWKVAESFRQKYPDNHKDLRCFHETVGKLLDQIASHQQQSSTRSYTEYCAYRAVHFGRFGIQENRVCATNHEKSCYFYNLGCGFSHSICSNPSSLNRNDVFMSLCFLTLKVGQALQRRNESKQHDSWISLSSEIMSQFRSAFIENNINAGDLTFCYRLLSLIKLHRIVHQILDDGSSSDNLVVHLRLAAEILATCIGPLCFRHQDVENERELGEGMKLQTMCSVGAECLKQAISVYDTIFHLSIENQFDLHQADVFIKDLFDYMSNDSVTPDCKENAAKFLAVIGKRRHDRKELSSALAPLLYSTKLFVHNSRLWTSESAMKQMKISGRLSFLSSVFKALNLEDEAILVLSLALVFDSMETPLLSNQQGEDPFLSLITHLASLTREVVSGDSSSIAASGQRSALINALLQSMINRSLSFFRLETTDDASVCSELGPDSVLDILVESLHGSGEPAKLFKRHCGVPFDITGIFKAIIFSRKTQSYFPPVVANFFWPETTLTSAEILARSAKILHRMHDLHAVENISAIIIEKYNVVCQLAEFFAFRIDAGDHKRMHVTLSIIYVIAAVSMLIYDSIVDFNEWSIKFFCGEKSNLPISFVELAEKYATKAAEILEDLNDSSCEWDLLFSAISVAVEVFRFQIACVKNPYDPSHTIDLNQIQNIVHKIEHLVPLDGQSNAIAKKCVLRILARLQDLFSLQGEELRAVQVALWTVDISRDAHGPHPWFEACAQSLLAAVSTVSKESNFKPMNITEGATKPAEIESYACRLRLLVNGDEKAADIQGSLRGLLQTLIAEVSTSEDDHVFRLLQWSKTTIFLALSECAWKKSDIPTVIHDLKQCFTSCKSILTLRNQEKRRAHSENHASFWIRIANSSISVKCIERQVACLQGIGLLYSHLGNYRKSLEYAKLALDATRDSVWRIDESKASFSTILDCSRNNPCRNSLEMKLRRLYLRLKALACPFDVVNGSISVDDHFCSLSKADFPWSIATISANRELEGIRDLFEAHNMLVGYSSLRINPNNRNIHFRSKERLDKFLHLPEVGILNDLVAAGAERRFNLIPQLQFDSQLWDAAYAFADLHRNNPTAETEALKSLKPLSISVACTNTSRAFAHYILGCSLVWKARQSGTLQELWNKSNVDHDDECPFLTKAQHHYKEAFYLLGSVCDLLKRNVTRCLALVTGPSDYSCALVLASIGTAIFPSSMYDEILTENENTFFDLLNAFNGIGSLNKESSRILHELANKSPTGWRYVASALCPTGEMLLASIDRKDNGESAACRVCCIFPTYSGQQSPCSLFPSSVFDEILKPLNEIMQQSRHQLLSALNTVADEEKHSYRREWWKGREDVDTRLRDLILATETRILTNPLARQILVGSEGSTAEDERANDENPANSAMANLASRFEAVSSDSTTFQLSNLKASELRDELLKRGFKSQKLRKMKKAELMELLVTQPEVGSVTAEEIDIEFCFRKEKINDEEDCIFLILDENLQRFPFESMLCFEDRTICRLPTIHVALLRILGANREKKFRSVFDARKTSYVLDPESNLSGTKGRLLPYLETFNERNGNLWQSAVGKIPPSSFITEGIRKETGLFLYFGHGGGQKYISRKDIEYLKESLSRPLSSVILMGCSSGKLESVNIRGSAFLGELPIQYEPEGIALSLLLAGSPCVVGNLWDVTDRDIDRFSIFLLEQLFGSDINCSIARSVAHVRKACKMRYIVGSSPVCYGFPVFPGS